MEGPDIRCQSGTTLAELVVALGVASILSVVFFGVLNQVSKVHVFEKRLTFYSSEVREVIHQMARDIRSAGSNPLSKPFLFDSDPASDRAVILDPGRDGDITNDIQVNFDRLGGVGRNEPDGDADDPREAVRYVYDADGHRISREVRMEWGWDQEIILVNVCSFRFSFHDSLKQPTTEAERVCWVTLDAITTTAPDDCYRQDEITRGWRVDVRIRNR